MAVNSDHLAIRHAIEHNSISRKHMIVEVSPVKPGDGSRIYAKSEIAVSDEGSKCGTTVDGNPIKKSSVKLTKEEHTIKLGRYKHALRIKWEPTVLSFSFSSKDLKTQDPLAHVRSRLEDLDIKTIIPYVIGQTTHVVQNKRNTAKGLQALVNGKHIVQESYLDALVYAATPSDLENLESLSPLEADFDSAWPDPTEHFPPPGKEAVPRPKEAFAPNLDRINVFEGYTFVFGDATQFENLQGAITNAHGKALLYQVKKGVTTAGEIVQFMQNAAGTKGLGRGNGGCGGVVFVRYFSKGRDDDWSFNLSSQVASLTGQRTIEQNEFLDAILANDATALCRTLPEPATSQEDSEPTSQPAPPPTADVDSQPSGAPSQASRKSSREPRVRSFACKMKTFDDGFDINSIPADAPDDEDGSVDPLPSMDIDPSTEPQSNLHEDEDMVASLLPGTAAMKRRRAETAQRNLDPSSSVPKTEEAPRPKRQKLDIREAARRHLEAEEDAQRQRRQEEAVSLQDSLKDVNVEQLKGLAIVEEMELPPRKQNKSDSRWDERWNGRKNFKKFRRKGDAGQPRHRIQTVIVPLEEVTRKDFGIGEYHWVRSRKSTDRSQLESHHDNAISQELSERSRPSSMAGTESATPVPRSQKRHREEQESDSDDELRFRFRRRRQ
ncbi:hypothetical protein EYZ11_000399 [Aspergillus tanneri]|uniref:FHA domain-containing protein n=1 Tax=Aspergillus tanneri TaxID=1220188 RepID=A0A4S3JXI1_9EURO|nr:hypothetical protein EYZ11_000399 [Aspergillus tanneri]